MEAAALAVVVGVWVPVQGEPDHHAGWQQLVKAYDHMCGLLRRSYAYRESQAIGKAPRASGLQELPRGTGGTHAGAGAATADTRAQASHARTARALDKSPRAYWHAHAIHAHAARGWARHPHVGRAPPCAGTLSDEDLYDDPEGEDRAEGLGEDEATYEDAMDTLLATTLETMMAKTGTTSPTRGDRLEEVTEGTILDVGTYRKTSPILWVLVKEEGVTAGRRHLMEWYRLDEVLTHPSGGRRWAQFRDKTGLPADEALHAGAGAAHEACRGSSGPVV